MSDETIRMHSSFEEQVLHELLRLDSHLTVVEERTGKIEDRTTKIEDHLVKIDGHLAKIDWDSFRRDFVQHNLEMKEWLGILDRKFDVVNHELLGIKAEQIRMDRRIDKIELDIRPHV